MKWNWENKQWPHFQWDSEKMRAIEVTFLQQQGIFVGIRHHLDNNQEASLVIDLISMEAIETSAIEGEILNRDSVQSSIQKHLGIHVPRCGITAAEAGIAEIGL